MKQLAERGSWISVSQGNHTTQSLTMHFSVAEVLFRTAPENQNRQNRTVKFGSVLFGPNNSWSCLVLGSYI